MAETSLSDIITRLKAEGQLTRNSGTNSLKSVKEVLLEQSKSSLEDKENNREQAQRDDRQTELLSEMARNGTKSMSLLSGNKLPEGGMGGLGVALLGAGVGLGAAGAGLGAFFMGLAGAEAIMTKFGSGDNLKKMMINLSAGLKSFETRDLVAIGAVLGMGAVAGAVPGFSGPGAGMGMGAVGFGLGAFFTGLAAGDMAMSWMNTDFSALKKMTRGLSDALGELDEKSLAVVGGLLATGGAAGALFGPKRVGKATIGMGAIGLGIGAFFAGLAAGDTAISWMSTDGTALKDMMKNMGEGFAALGKDPAAFAAVGGLLSAGAAGGALFGPSKIGQAGIGMGAIGLGLGAFFAGLSAGDAAASWMSADGTTLKNIMKNLAEGLSSFSGGQLAGLTGMLAVGGLFGAIPGGAALVGGAALGMGAIGLGLGAFFAGFAVTGEAAAFVGADGSAIKAIMINMSDGLKSFNGLDGANLLTLVPGLIGLGPAMIAFLGSEGIVKLGGSIKDTIAGVWDWMTGNDGETKNKGMIAQVVEMLEPMAGLDMAKVTQLDLLSSALDNLGEAMSKLGKVRLGNLEDTFTTLAQSVSYAIPLLDKMYNGQVIGAGWGDGYPEIDFGVGLKGLPLDAIEDRISKMSGSLTLANSMTQTMSNGATVIAKRIPEFSNLSSEKLENVQSENSNLKTESTINNTNVTTINNASSAINNNGQPVILNNIDVGPKPPFKRWGTSRGTMGR